MIVLVRLVAADVRRLILFLLLLAALPASAQTLAQLDSKAGPIWSNALTRIATFQNSRPRFVSIVGNLVTPTNGDFITITDTNFIAVLGTNQIPFSVRIDEYVSGRGPGFYVMVEAQLGSSPSNIIRRIYQSFPPVDSGWYVR